MKPPNIFILSVYWDIDVNFTRIAVMAYSWIIRHFSRAIVEYYLKDFFKILFIYLLDSFERVSFTKNNNDTVTFTSCILK